MFEFDFTNAGCRNYHPGIRIAVLDYFRFGSKETNFYVYYLSCFCLCAVYVSADDTGSFLYVIYCYCCIMPSNGSAF